MSSTRSRARVGAAIVAGAALLSAASPVSAQAYIGVIVGQMVAEQQAAAAEAACRAGVPPTPKVVTAVTSRMGRVMDAYFALTPKSDARAISRVFAMKSDQVHWRDDKGTVPIDQLGDRLVPPAATPVLTGVVVGGDGDSGRELWTVTQADASVAPTVYAVDIGIETGHMFDYALGMRILHMTVTPASEAPPPPGAFCHLDSVQGY